MMLMLLYGFIGLVGAAIIVLSIGWTAVERITEGQQWTLTIALALFSALLLVLPLSWYVRRKWNQELANFRTHRAGREGEEWVTDTVRATLDNRWTVFRSSILPGRRDDIDLVLVGPAGVWALEIKAYNTPVRVHNAKWEYMRGNTWHTVDSDPITQARKNAQRLRYYLEEHGIRTHVNAAVVLAEPQQISNFGPTGEPVWLQYDIENQLTRLNTMSAILPDSEVAKVSAAVTKVVDSESQRAI
jgi:hypothetical protein